MNRYHFTGEDVFADEIHGRIFWYTPASEVHDRVMEDGPSLVVRDSEGGSQSADDFWDWAGHLSWDDSRVGEQPQRLSRVLAAAPS